MLLLTVLALATTLQASDTTIQVAPGSRLRLSSFEGAVSVQSWSRSAVRVEADHDDETRVEVDQSGRTVNVRARSRYGPPQVTWRLTVPADITLDLSNHSGTVTVAGTRNEISVSTVEGDISVQGGSGLVSLQSVDGRIDLTGANGRITLSTVDGDIAVRGVRGSLKGSTVDGAFRLEDIEAGDVDLSTVDGNITFEGTIQSAGRYRMSSHDGDLHVAVPAISADVSVSTFSGEFESDFPVVLTGSQQNRRMSFTLGNGGARLELESFSGTIHLKRATGRKP